MNAREAKKACATKGLEVICIRRDKLFGGWCELTVVSKPSGRTRMDEVEWFGNFKSWPLAVAAFKGWRAEWLRTDGRKRDDR